MTDKQNRNCGENPTFEIQASEDEKVENNEVSSFRLLASQFVAIFPLIFIKIRYGMGIGYTVVLIPTLSKKNFEFGVTLDDLTWFTSYCFVIPIAAISGGFIAQYIGVRRLLMISYLLHISADLLFFWANSSAMLLTAQVIVGFTAGITKGPCYTYVAEIVPPKYRSMVIETINLIVICGRFFAILLGNFMYWRTQTLVSLVFPVIGFFFVHFIPDSPQWLANKNRLDDAEKSLARLRGWTSTKNVKDELYSSILNAKTIVETSSDNSVQLKGSTKWKKALSLFLDKSFYIPLLTINAISFFNVFNGITETFSGLVFENIKSPIDARLASTILSALSIVATLSYISSIRFLGKRVITLASAVIIIVGLIIAVTCLYENDSDLPASSIAAWIPSIALIVSNTSYHYGLGKLIHLLSSELFPHKLRYIGGGMGHFMDQILSAAFDKSFLYIMNAITFPGTLIVTIVLNSVSFAIIYYILPETEGITLLEIEGHYTGTQPKKNTHCKYVY